MKSNLFTCPIQPAGMSTVLDERGASKAKPRGRGLRRKMNSAFAVCVAAFYVSLAGLRAADSPKPVGPQGVVGCLANPKTVNRLEITKPGVYENYRVDAQGKGGNIVKITADNVTLRNCEIFNGSGNGVGVFGTNVVIENCRIHHLLKGTFQAQDDAHGITGRWG